MSRYIYNQNIDTLIPSVRTLINGIGNIAIEVTCDSNFANKIITATKDTISLTQICPSTSPYKVYFEGIAPGTWTISCELDGEEYTTQAIVQDVSCALRYGFNWQEWVDTSRDLDSSDYDTIDELLADEKAVRELCLEHATVDYLASITYSDEIVEKIINNDIFAKWVNLCDYALDFLYANQIIADLMDEADKYFYGEWVKIKTNLVPIMTSNTTPSGTVFASSVFENNPTYAAWHVFASSGSWICAQNYYTNSYIGYDFGEATPIKFVSISNSNGNYGRSPVNYKIQGSSDNQSWNDLTGTLNDFTTTNQTFTYELAEEANYRYYRLLIGGIKTASEAIVEIKRLTLDNYVWQPKGNVPIMTSNTAPYGTASSGATFSADYAAWKAFDGDDSTMAIPCNNGSSGQSATSTLVYKSTNPICVKRLKDFGRGNNKTAILQGSNDGSTWTDLVTYNTEGIHQNYIDVPNNTAYYLYHRIYATPTTTSDYVRYSSLQFYGRELKVSVPVMTSDTAPYGEAISNGDAYKAFDGNLSTFDYVNTNDEAVGYDFGRPVIVKLATLVPRASDSGGYVRYFTIKASNDKTNWTLLYTGEKPWYTDQRVYPSHIDNTEGYRYYAYFRNGNGWADTSFQPVELQFYGLDYSEKEFEAGTTKKWLYDHGVELVPFTTTKGSSTTTAKPINDGNEIYIAPLSGTSASLSNFSDIATAERIDLTNYSLYRGILGTRMTFNTSGDIACGSMFIWNILPTDGGSYSDSNRIAYSQQTSPLGDKYSKAFLNISAVNQEGYVSANVQYYNGRSISFTELWLE